MWQKVMCISAQWHAIAWLIYTQVKYWLRIVYSRGSQPVGCDPLGGGAKPWKGGRVALLGAAWNNINFISSITFFMLLHLFYFWI